LEANKSHVPVIAVCDSNIDPRMVQWPIPGNDDASKAIEMITMLMAEAINEGKAHPVEKSA
jgi:small subunit ribosomal protein S2